ncbi:hypothetical protein JW935_12555 [candidate division KSB1 bacterium]|nr:hypothetical protein [candidate division KSB1 bacterium]
MIRMAFLLIFFVSLSGLLAQEDAETLFSGKIESGGYGAFTMKTGQVHGRTGLFLGGQGGWIINHQFVIGGGGCGLVSEYKIAESEEGDDLFLSFGYGGGMLEYIALPNKLIHFSVQCLIGAGGVTYMDKTGNTDPQTYPADACFVLEPGFTFELNVTRHFRINLGGSYRMVRGVNFVGTSNEDLSDVTFNVLFKFGSF